MDIDQIIYIQLLKTMNNAISDNADDTLQDANTVIQYFDAPYDKMTLASTVLSSLITDPNSNLVWASSSVTSGFTWDNGGLYDPFSNVTHPYTDQLTLGATVTVTSAFPADLKWGSATVNPNWSWSMGAIWQ